MEIVLVAGICETIARDTPCARNSLWFGTWVLVRQVWEAPRFPVLRPTTDPGTANHPSTFQGAIPGQARLLSNTFSVSCNLTIQTNRTALLSYPMKRIWRKILGKIYRYFFAGLKN